MEWTEERPWGRFKVLLDLPHTKVKLIEVDPKQRLSLQSHQKRDEFWTVVKGTAVVKKGWQTLTLQKGGSVYIMRTQKHRIENIGDSQLQFVEVQTGEYFGEDDIERFDDDYGRE
jgi:mannose-6-phosphate isomerase-like protein (cupin superfamily)